MVGITAGEGVRLSDMPEQDSYSYGLAHVYIDADSEDDPQRKYEQTVAALPFEFSPVTEAS